MNTWISILSLIVAVLAVVIAPWVSLTIAKRQIRASLKTADKQIIAPMRQAWINKLRELLAKLTSDSVHYHVGGVDGRTSEEGAGLLLLLYHIRLMLNPKEDDHQRLEELINKMMLAIQDKKATEDDFSELRVKVLDLSRTILKSEWNRVKEPILQE